MNLSLARHKALHQPFLMTSKNKSVHFSEPLEISIIYTYSATEYDRSCFSLTMRSQSSPRSRSPPRPLPAYPVSNGVHKRPFVKPLDLSGIPNACRRRPTWDNCQMGSPDDIPKSHQNCISIPSSCKVIYSLHT